MQSVKEDGLSSCVTPFDPTELNELNEVRVFLGVLCAPGSCLHLPSLRAIQLPIQ